MVKRFTISGVTREKVYDLTKGTEGSKILYLGVTSVDKAPVVQIQLRPRPKLKNLNIDVDFSEVLIKNRSAVGNIITKFGIAKLRVVDPGAAPTAGSPSASSEQATTAGAAPKGTPDKKAKDPKSQIKIDF
jgi:topoisomerase-4 subunit A